MELTQQRQDGQNTRRGQELRRADVRLEGRIERTEQQLLQGRLVIMKPALGAAIHELAAKVEALVAARDAVVRG